MSEIENIANAMIAQKMLAAEFTEIDALIYRMQGIELSCVPGSLVEEQFNEAKGSSRYPYTYAYDIIRRIMPRMYTRAEISTIMQSYQPDQDKRLELIKQLADLEIMLTLI